MKKYLVITGGQLYNKGAQAMVFISTDELRRRFPDREIVVLSKMDMRRSKEEREKYRFKIQGYPGAVALLLMQTGIGRIFYKVFGKTSEKEYLELMEQAAALVDVSGYALGSDWGYKRSIFYLARIQIAKAFRVPVYLMPQSFGPFDYQGVFRAWMRRKIKRVLGCADTIMCREQDGYALLHDKFGLSNSVLTPDLVMQNIGISPDNIYRELPKQRIPEIPARCVAVIPNKKTFQFGDRATLENLYRRIVEKLLEQDRPVLLCYHSTEDLEICRLIKSNFAHEQRVILQEEEPSCLEFDAMVGQVDFVIASRYHAIVHAYRNCVPAVVLGWAVKYRELLSAFSQERFLFDVRGELNESEILGAVSDMCERHAEYAAGMKEPLARIQGSNVFDCIKQI